MSVTESDLEQIVVHLNSMGDTIPIRDKDSIARVVKTLFIPQTPETIEQQILETSQASAVIGYLENKWRGIATRYEIELKACKGRQAKVYRDTQRASGEKTSVAQVSEFLQDNPEVMRHEAGLSLFTEIADIMQSLRYAIKTRSDGLLELSRTERQTARQNG